MEELTRFMFAYSHLGVLLALLATGLGLPVPEDIILITGGVIAEQTGTFWTMVALCMFGVLAGDLTIYGLGYHYGEAILNRRPFVWLVSPVRLRRVRFYYRKYGYWAIFISRFLAGLRATSFLLAGMSRVSLRIFLLADGGAALVSVPFFIFVGYYYAEDIQNATAYVQKLEQTALIALGALAAVVLLIRWGYKRRASGGNSIGPSNEDEQFEDK